MLNSGAPQPEDCDHDPFSGSAITSLVVFIFVYSSLLVRINTQLLQRSLQAPTPPGDF